VCLNVPGVDTHNFNQRMNSPHVINDLTQLLTEVAVYCDPACPTCHLERVTQHGEIDANANAISVVTVVVYCGRAERATLRFCFYDEAAAANAVAVVTLTDLTPYRPARR
jgi:hypothetical protein